MKSASFSRTYHRKTAAPMNTPPAQISENTGSTKGSAGSESPHQENEGISKGSPCSATASTTAPQKGRKRKTKAKDGGSNESDEATVPKRTRFRGQVRGSRNNTDTNNLDTGTFLRYLMHIWDAFPEEKVEPVTYFDPCWFYMYTNQNRSADVVSWIKEKGIFSKKYVFVPIVMWSHWSLLIFCHLGQSLHSKTDAPCMLLLDSLQRTGPTRLESFIRRLLIDIYKSEDRPESKQQLSKIPLLIPKVPQQKKGDECGFYVLYYIHLFVERLPERFSISEGYPYFMKRAMFTDEEVESFSKTLAALPVAVSDHDPASVDSDDSVELIETPLSDDRS